MKLITSAIRIIASTSNIWTQKIKDEFDILCRPREEGAPLDENLLRQTYHIFRPIPTQLIKDCGVKDLFFSNTMGPNRPYYPNHGFYINHTVTLNNDIFYHPDVMNDFFDHHGYFIDRPTQTIYHEFAHGYDVNNGDLSKKGEWTKLSGWSSEPLPGLKRLIIKGTHGIPDVTGEMYFDPKAEFTRFYAKRNPWDDWADSFSFYIGGLVDKVPPTKREYLEKLLKKYSA